MNFKIQKLVNQLVVTPPAGAENVCVEIASNCPVDVRERKQGVPRVRKVKLCTTTHARLVTTPTLKNLRVEICVPYGEAGARRLEKECDLLLEVAKMKGIIA